LIGRRKSAPKLAAVFDGLAGEVEDGRSLADAMADVPSVFKPVHVAMVRAGEAGGFLEQALAQLGGLVRNQVELRQKVVGSLIYPAAIVCVGLCVLTILFAFFIPMFSETYEDVQLGAISQMVFGISDVVRGYGLVILVALVAAAVGLRQAWKRDDVRVRIVEVVSRVPVVGPLLRSLAVARVCRMLGTLMGSGVGMLQALTIARDAAGLPRMSEAVDASIEAVRAGEPLSGPWRESGLFPDDVIEMIDVAESANTLEPTLVTIAESVEQRTDRQLTIAVRLIEPLVIVAIAVCVVFVAAGLILPMLQFGQLAG
jgi:general secretion pathway protein F/type IV pilus assembly protein PilC